MEYRNQNHYLLCSLSSPKVSLEIDNFNLFLIGCIITSTQRGDNKSGFFFSIYTVVISFRNDIQIFYYIDFAQSQKRLSSVPKNRWVSINGFLEEKFSKKCMRVVVFFFFFSFSIKVTRMNVDNNTAVYGNLNVG